LDSLLFLSTAFGLGAAHALEPGHGKTLVAAYLTGTKGKLSDAFALGILVTFFHTLSVFALGLVGIFLADFFLSSQEGMIQSLEFISGLIILGIGVMLFWRRFVVDASPTECECHLHHTHHDEKKLVKKVQSRSNWKDIFSLGFASGISPCPAAIVALIASVTLGGYGKLPEALFYLIVFSLGLSSVLVAIGAVLIVSSGRVSNFFVSKNSRFPVMVSQFSTFLIMGLGIYLMVRPFVMPADHDGFNLHHVEEASSSAAVGTVIDRTDAPARHRPSAFDLKHVH
jgi:nickel/cobalt exporter